MNLAFLRRPMFLAIVVIPNALSIIYFGVLASPVYISTASLTVLNPNRSASNLTSMLSGGSGDGSSEGAYILKDYVNSWGEFRRISNALDLARNYSLGDPVGRYGGLLSGFRRNDVSLWNYYRRNIDVSVDLKSGIASLKAHGYRPDFAEKLATTVLADAVQHMNEMSRAQEQDYVGAADARKATLEGAIRDDEAALAQYRARVGVYDPKEQYLSGLTLVNSLTARDAELKSEYASVEKATPNSPETRNLSVAIAAIQGKIAEAQGQFTALGRTSADYERLVAHRDNDLSLLQQANLAAQDAHQKAIQNRYYLEVISQPSQPQTPELPRRLWWIGGVLLATLLLWGLLR